MIPRLMTFSRLNKSMIEILWNHFRLNSMTFILENVTVLLLDQVLVLDLIQILNQVQILNQILVLD